MRMSNTLGKIQFVSQPALPAKCVCCGNHWKGKGEFMIDFQVSMDDYGALLFCENCARELAGLVGIEAIESRNEQIKNLQVRVQEVQEENVRLNTTLDSLFSIRPSLRPSSGPVGPADSKTSNEGE